MSTHRAIIIGCIALQVLILGGMFAKTYYPLLFGRAVKLAAYAQDPRDLFRGNYSQIRYEFSNLPLDSIVYHGDTSKVLSYGDWVYAELQAMPSGYYTVKALWQTRPQDQQIYLKITPTNIFYTNPKHHQMRYYSNHVSFKAGIESFFATPQQATEIDRRMQDRDSLQGYANIMVAEDGTARIKELGFDVLPKPTTVSEN